MSWSSLPDDVVGVILSNLSLVELARVSTTCGTFQELYRRQLAREHEARLGLAVSYFGREPITTVTAAIIQLLNGGPLNPACDKISHCLGVWPPRPSPGHAETLSVSTHRHARLPGDIVYVGEDSPFWRFLQVYIPRDRKGVQFYFCPLVDDDDIRMVALVQAILSGGLAQFIRDAKKWAQIDITHIRQVPAGLHGFRRAVLKAQAGPLMQLASRCISIERICTEYADRWVEFTECLQIGQVASAADEASR